MMTGAASSSLTPIILISTLCLIYMIWLFLPLFQKPPESTTAEFIYDKRTYKYLRTLFIPHPNGTLTRVTPLFFPEGLRHSTLTTPIRYKDVSINEVNGTWARLFLAGHPKPGKKIPIVVLVHGGGFFIGTAIDPTYLAFGEDIANRLGVLVVSVTYRLAPEHRLPAAYHDVLEGLTWLRDGKDEWVIQYGDLSKCVMMGQGAGGNIVYHVGLMAADKNEQLKPLTIRGLVLMRPFFGGVALNASEIQLENAESLHLYKMQSMWRLAFPVGANRSHRYCDPRQGGRELALLDRVRDLGWRVVLMGFDADPLYDVHMELVKLMERRGVNLKTKISRGKGHGAFIDGPPQRKGTILFLRSLRFFS